MNNLRGHFSVPGVGVCLLLTATLAGSNLTSHRESAELGALLDTIPFEISDFRGKPNPPMQESVARQLKASSYIDRRYVKDGLNVDVFVAYYARQRAGESMHSPKNCLPGAGWEIWDYDRIPISAGGQTFTINKYSISRAGDRKVVLYWYQTKGRIFASEYLGKLMLARDAFLQNSTAAAIVRIIVPDRPRAVENASGVVSGMILQIRRCFGR